MNNPFVDMFRQISIIRILEALQGVDARRQQPIDKTVLKPKAYTSRQQPFSEIIQAASKAYGIDEGIIKAVIKQESSFNPHAQSSCGAMGLMQLMPTTAKSLGVKDVFNPQENIMAGTKYLKQKLNEFNGDLPMALAAYNAGSGAVKKYGGIPPYKETQAYVKKVMNSVDQMA